MNIDNVLVKQFEDFKVNNKYVKIDTNVDRALLVKVIEITNNNIMFELIDYGYGSMVPRINVSREDVMDNKYIKL